MNPVIRRLAYAAAAVAALLLITTACGGGHPGKIAAGHSSVAAAAGSAMADPTISNDLNQGENELLSNLQTNWNSAHPVSSVEAAIHATFPHGDTGKIVTYAIRHFTPAVMTTSGPGSARDNFLQGVYDYALTQGATPATGTATAPASTPAPATTGAGA